MCGVCGVAGVLGVRVCVVCVWRGAWCGWWQVRHGPVGFGEGSKSAAMLIRDSGPHFLCGPKSASESPTSAPGTPRCPTPQNLG